MNRYVALSALALLVACGTPQEQCISRETRDLRTLDRLIAESEGNLRRGYAIEEYRTTELVPYPCYRSRGPDAPPLVSTCFRRDWDIDTRPKAIDLDGERAKLETMKRKRVQLARAAESVIAQCRALYPE